MHERQVMRVISRAALRDFWRQHPDAERALRGWEKRVKYADWKGFADTRADFPASDRVGKFVVFNVGGNKYRLICSIHFNRGRLYIRNVLTHEEYDKGYWKLE